MTGFFHYGRDRARQSSAPPAATAPACRSLRQYRRACVLPRFRSVRTVPYFTRLASPPLGNALRALGIDESSSRSISAILRAAGPLPGWLSGWLRMIRQGILRETAARPATGYAQHSPLHSPRLQPLTYRGHPKLIQAGNQLITSRSCRQSVRMRVSTVTVVPVSRKLVFLLGRFRIEWRAA